MEDHVAVRWKDSIVVLSDYKRHNIYMYNLWTECWKKYASRKDQHLPIEYGQRGVEIGSDIYMFGGFDKLNVLWKLTRSKTNSFAWSILYIKRKKRPSSRRHHSVWEYDEKMWIFGGRGRSPDNYLNDYGEFTGDGSCRHNNQLFFYDPRRHMWKNVQCSGDIPAPRANASAALMKDKVYLFGGEMDVSFNISNTTHLYELCMHSVTWTQIEFSGLRYNGKQKTSLIPVIDNQLLLYGSTADYEKGFMWILDVQSHTWKEYADKKMGYNYDHTGTTGLHGQCHGSAIILGEAIQSEGQARKNVITVRLGPKSLQQLAMQTIYQHLDSTLLKMLPKKLQHKIMGRPY